MTDAARPQTAWALAGGWCWFDRAERIERGGARRVIAAEDLPGDVLARLTSPRAPIAGLGTETPRLMGILNVTPDSFSDGGQFNAPDAALARAQQMRRDGAEIIDIGGESTRPGAKQLSPHEEIARTELVIAALQAAAPDGVISIDSRNALTTRAAVAAGARLINDVSALTHDPDMAGLAAQSGLPVCLMHALGDPATMQDDPRYDDVLLDVYDFLATRVAVAEAAGIARDRIILDPGIGFGKTVQHNLALIRGMSLFHGLGCVLMLGASRKRFIGSLASGTGGMVEASARMPGSVAVGLAAVAQGVQWLRVHDVAPTWQALRLWQAVTIGKGAKP